jgi:uncharacterized membrane protein YbhN (UPF0104 family)
MTARERPGTSAQEPHGSSALRWRGLLKLAVSVATLAFVLHAVPMDRVGAVLTSAAPGWLLAALAIFTATQAVSALRFAYIARELGAALPFGRSLRLHYIGLWLNQVLPTGLGGDVVKAAMLRHDAGLGTAVRVAVLDRLSGLIVLLLHAAVLLPLYLARFPDAYPLHAVCLMAVAGLALLALALVLAPRANAHWGHLRLVSRALMLVGDVSRLLRGASLRRQALTSAAVHVNGMAAYALIGRALGVDIAAVDYALLSPMVFLVALIPVSFAGWGLRELGAVWLFGLAGVASHLALAMSIAFGMLLLAASVPGVMLMLMSASASTATTTPGPPR